jgi:hypothetical protein
MNRCRFILTIVVSLLCGTSLLSATHQNPSFEIPKDVVHQLMIDINTNENNFRLSEAI